DFKISGRRPVRGSCARSMIPRRFATMTDKTGAAAGVPPKLPRTAVRASEALSLLARGQPWTDNQASGSRGRLERDAREVGTHFLVAQGEGGFPATVTAWVYDWLARRFNAPGELVIQRCGA